MLPTHLRFPILAIATDRRGVVVACLDQHLELVAVRAHDARRFAKGSSEAHAFVERCLRRDLVRFRAKTVIIEKSLGAGPVRQHVTDLAVDLARRHEVRATRVDRTEVLATLGARSLREGVEALAGRYPRCRCPCPAHMIANDRPILTAIVLGHAVGLASLSAEASETDIR